MPIISAQNLTVGFADRILFGSASFDIEKNDRVGLIGANGCGKTTLFKIILKQLEPAEGAVIMQNTVKVGCVEQHACSDFTKTAYEEVLTVYSDVIETEKELESINNELLKGNGDAKLIEKQEYLREKFEARDGLSYRSRARSALTGLGFTAEETDKNVSLLSGGQRTKISLAKLLLSGADIILLDEPTNHLDTQSVEWLEDFLKKYNGSAIIISHDRFFLDKTTEKTMEIEGGRLFYTKGNYSVYHNIKQERELTEQRENENIQKEIKRIEAMIEQQRRFNRERNFITIASKEKQIERLKSGLHDTVRRPDEMKLSFKVSSESGNEVLNCSSLSKSFDGKKLFENISFSIRKHDKVFILGPNGCGKTTLLKIIMGYIISDSGRIDYGTGVRIGYFEQTQSKLNNPKTVLQEVYDTFPTMTVPEIRNVLAAFLFKGDSIEKRMNELSGGERAKVAMLEIMLKGCNFLILDEPTNHLDISSREVLENALDEYDGTIIAVSHDRYFINRLAQKLLCFDGKELITIDGNYDDYLALRDGREKESAPAKQKKQNDYLLKKELAKAERMKKTEIAKLEKEIAELEEQKTNLQKEIENPEFSSDYQNLTELTEKLNEISIQQDELYIKWMELSEQ